MLLLGATLTGLLVLVAVGLSLLFNSLNTGVLGLLLVDGLNQVTLVPVDVSLDLKIELVIQVLVNLLLSAILLEKTAEDAKTTNPQELGGSTGVGATLSLTNTGVSAESLGGVSLSHSEAGVDLNRLANDETILVELTDSLTGVGLGYLRDLIRVKPDTTLTTSLYYYNLT